MLDLIPSISQICLSSWLFFCICLTSIVLVLSAFLALWFPFVTSRASPSLFVFNLWIHSATPQRGPRLNPSYDLSSSYSIIYITMRLSTIAALCAAPLALASALKGIEVSVEQNGKSASSVDEVIIIWVNEGGGAATSTVTSTVTVTDASGTAVAAATHSVSLEVEGPSRHILMLTRSLSVALLVSCTLPTRSRLQLEIWSFSHSSRRTTLQPSLLSPRLALNLLGEKIQVSCPTSTTLWSQLLRWPCRLLLLLQSVSIFTPTPMPLPNT